MNSIVTQTLLIIFISACWYYIGYMAGEFFTQKKVKKAITDYMREVNNTLMKMSEAVKTSTASNHQSDMKKAYQILEEVNAIAKRQIDLMGNIDGPSRGAAYSRWRNDVISNLKEMEATKISKLREILAMGLDPKITIVVDGKEEKKRLSEAIKEYEKDYPATPASSTPAPTKPKPKFTVIHNPEV